MNKISEQERPLWEEYWQTKSIESRNRLVENYMGVVGKLVGTMSKRLADDADLDDLRSAGYVGLINAVSLYDPTKNTAPTSYLSIRVRGEMLDWLRNLDVVPRQARGRLNRWKAAEEKLTACFERKPTRDEMFAECRVSEREFERMQHVATYAGSRQCSLDKVIAEDDGRLHRLAEIIPDEKTIDPAVTVERRDLVRFILDKLPPRFAIAMTHYLMESLTMKQIGRIMDRSESLISQRIKAAYRILMASDLEAAL